MTIFNDTSYNNHNLLFDENKTLDGKVSWESPSNIALIKYWGKYKGQLPRNPSLSFSLKNSVSQTRVAYKTVSTKGFKYKFTLDGKPKPSFESKLNSFFETILPIFPFLEQLELKIDSANTFPHSSGIASSASGMSALALCICTIEQKEFGHLKHPDDFFRKASYVARLGSGSAARSVYGGWVNWGRVEWEGGSSDYFADPFSLPVHKVFNDFQDSILILASGAKKISSTNGHAAMEKHPYSQDRYTQARENYLELTQALESGELSQFIGVVEHEALSLHALMISSRPGYFLMKPESLAVIEKIRDYRELSKVPVCFTLDAGPNIHVLYPASAKDEVVKFIESEIVKENKDIQLLHDEVGKGPKKGLL